jgi:hypothetical protein
VSATGAAPGTSPDFCTTCGQHAPTKWVIFYQNIGMFVMRREAQVSGFLCRRCIRAYFKSYTLTTLFLGWWGAISLVVTPFYLLNNIARFLMSLKMPEPSPAMANISLASTSEPISVGAGDRKFKLIYGALVVTVLLGVVAYYSVNLLEKHAPSLNARLHKGEITEGPDADYAGLRLGKDIAALSAPTKSEDWEGLRAEYLSRESYLNDLQEQNEKLQRAAATERANKSAKYDNCEQLALDVFMPAINDYTRVMGDFLAVLKSSRKRTDEAIVSLKTIAAREDDARSRMSRYFSERKAKGCEK